MGHEISISPGVGVPEVSLATALDASIDSVAASGDVAADAVDSGNPVKIGGYAAGTTPPTAVSDGDRVNSWMSINGAMMIAARSVAALDGMSNNLAEIPLNAGGAGPLLIAGMLFNGASWDRQRTPSVFKTVDLGAATTETTIWTPASGKKFRLMGFVLTAGAASKWTFKDNTSGTTIFEVGAATDPIVVNLGNGILSGTANNVLTVTRGTSGTLVGTVWGTEE